MLDYPNIRMLGKRDFSKKMEKVKYLKNQECFVLKGKLRRVSRRK